MEVQLTAEPNMTQELFSSELDLLVETSLQELANLLQRDGMLCCDMPAKLPNTFRKLAPCCDSRRVQSHHIFVALAGDSVDGHQFIRAALQRGAQAVVYQNEIPGELLDYLAQRGIAALRVAHSRQALSLLSAHCFGYPSRGLAVLGITGTDGKSSIAYLAYQILQRSQKKPVGLLSTFGLDLGCGLEPNPVHQTTPESLVIQCALAKMKAQGCDFAILECSSHGLSPRTARLLHVELCGALFSNLSPEHLEFHGTMACYAQDKAQIFTHLQEGGVAVWNADESPSEILYAGVEAYLPRNLVHLGYSCPSLQELPSTQNQQSGSNPDDTLSQLPHKTIPYREILYARDLHTQVTASAFCIGTDRSTGGLPCEIPIPGSIYVSNTLGALALCCGILQNEAHAAGTFVSLQPFLSQLLPKLCDVVQTPTAHSSYPLALSAPKGRMELVPAQAPFTVLIDYAHSPGAFARLLPNMQSLLQVGKQPRKPRMFVLFGSGGQRDKKKRPLQGAIAAQYADVIFLCDEDPREENPMSILQDIQAGIPEISGESGSQGFVVGQNLFLIPDRREAMARAFALARAGDLVLLLGKGHETSMIFAGHCEQPWDEQRVAQKLLK